MHVAAPGRRVRLREVVIDELADDRSFAHPGSTDHRDTQRLHHPWSAASAPWTATGSGARCPETRGHARTHTESEKEMLLRISTPQSQIIRKRKKKEKEETFISWSEIAAESQKPSTLTIIIIMVQMKRNSCVLFYLFSYGGTPLPKALPPERNH